MTDNPFITVFTRCCMRPRMLENCINSVRAQTAAEAGIHVEQLLVVDREGGGLAHANKMFWEHRHVPCGEYVYHLDDDGVFKDWSFIEQVRDAAVDLDYPDVFLVRSMQEQANGKHRLLPLEHVWRADWEGGERPKWEGSGYNVVVKTELWRAQVDRYYRGQGEHWHTGGDYWFVTGVMDLDVQVRKLDVVAAQGKRRRGKEFETGDLTWFSGALRTLRAVGYKIERVGGNSVYRLLHRPI